MPRSWHFAGTRPQKVTPFKVPNDAFIGINLERQQTVCLTCAAVRAAAHADGHRLAVHRLQARFEGASGGQSRSASAASLSPRAPRRSHIAPAGPQLAAVVLDHGRDLGVDGRLLGLVQLDPRQPALCGPRIGGSIRCRPRKTAAKLATGAERAFSRGSFAPGWTYVALSRAQHGDAAPVAPAHGARCAGRSGDR